MSYIRCLSNPEGMYIWADVNGRVAITGKNIPIESPVYVPLKDWNKLLKEYVKEGHPDRLRVGTLTLREVSVPNYWEDLKTFLKYPFSYYRIRKAFGPQEDFQIRLFYRGKKIVDMWESTFGFIAYTFCSRK